MSLVARDVAKSNGGSSPLVSVTHPKGVLLQRKYETKKYDQEKKQRSLQKKSSSRKMSSEVPPVVHEVLKSSGQPLDTDTRKIMQTRIGHNFSNVRIHTGLKAAESAKSVSSRAYTVGSDIVLGKRNFNPVNLDDKHLLAHELVHVSQQRLIPNSKDNLQIGDSNDVREYEADQAANDIANGRKAYVSSVLTKPTVQRSPAGDLVHKHKNWYKGLDEESLAKDLLDKAKKGEFETIQSTFDEIGFTNRDDLAVNFMEAASDSDLLPIVKNEKGRRLLDRLFDELTEGKMMSDEAIQADRIIKLKMSQKSISAFPQSPSELKKKFPYRLPGLTVVDDAPIRAKRSKNGKIFVKMPARVSGVRKFAEETKTLPSEVFSSGIELPEDEIITVKMYDLGGVEVQRPALFLVQLSNETSTKVVEKIVESSAIGITLGTSGVAGVGARNILGTVLMWADRVALVVGTLTSIISEHRGWIIEKHGADGKEFVEYIDILNSAIAIYGGARVLLSMPKLLSGLRKVYNNWIKVARKSENTLSTAQSSAVNKISKEMEEVLESAENAKKARQGTGTKEIIGDAGASERAEGSNVIDFAEEKAKRINSPGNKRALAEGREGFNKGADKMEGEEFAFREESYNQQMGLEATGTDNVSSIPKASLGPKNKSAGSVGSTLSKGNVTTNTKTGGKASGGKKGGATGNADVEVNEEGIVKVDPRSRGAAIEDAHILEHGYIKLKDWFKTLDAVIGAKKNWYKLGDYYVNEFSGGKGISVKSTNSTNEAYLQNYFDESIEALKDFEEGSRRLGKVIDKVRNLDGKELHLIFDEETIVKDKQALVNLMQKFKAKAKQIDIDFEWWIYRDGKEKLGSIFVNEK